jgi:hypothetical protein
MPPSWLAPASSRPSHCPEPSARGASRMEPPCPRQGSPRSGSRGKSIQNRADPGCCTSRSPGSGCSPGWHPRSPGTQCGGKFLLAGTPWSAFSSRVLGAPGPVGSGSHRLRGWWEDEDGRADGSRTKDGRRGTRRDVCVPRGPRRKRRKARRLGSSPGDAADVRLPGCLPLV